MEHDGAGFGRFVRQEEAPSLMQVPPICGMMPCTPEMTDPDPKLPGSSRGFTPRSGGVLLGESEQRRPEPLSPVSFRSPLQDLNYEDAYPRLTPLRERVSYALHEAATRGDTPRRTTDAITALLSEHEKRIAANTVTTSLNATSISAKAQSLAGQKQATASRMHQDEVCRYVSDVGDKIMLHVDKCFQQQRKTLNQVVDAVNDQQKKLKDLEEKGVGSSSLQGQHNPTLQAILQTVQELQGGQYSQFSGPSSPGLAAKGEYTSRRRPSRDSRDDPAANTLTTPLLDEENDDLTRLKQLTKRSALARMSTLFPETEQLKSSVTSALSRRLYNVESLYHETGFFQRTAKNDFFKGFIYTVIFVNTLWIGYETDNNKSEILSKAPLMFQIGDNVFCSIFVMEIFVRFMAFKRKCNAFTDPWFLFDSSLVCLMIWETWVQVLCFLFLRIQTEGSGNAIPAQALRVTRLARLVRVARTTRLLKAFPELAILAGAMAQGLRSMLAVLVLLVSVLYVFAVSFTMLLSQTDIGFGVFDSVPHSMNALLVHVLCGPDADFMMSLLKHDGLCYAMYLAFLLIAILTLMNMLIAILCDVVSEEADETKEAALTAEVQRQISRLANDMDHDGSGTIDREEFDSILNDPETTTAFYKLGVDIVALGDFANFIYEQCDEFSFKDFANLVSNFRGNKQASVQDVMDLRRYLTVELLSFESRIIANSSRTAGHRLDSIRLP